MPADINTKKVQLSIAFILLLCILVYFSMDQITVTSRNLTKTLETGRGFASFSSERKPIPPVSNRRNIAHILQQEGMKVGAELGVQKGAFARHTLDIWKSCERYYLVCCFI
jgi:hypothetical protein